MGINDGWVGSPRAPLGGTEVKDFRMAANVKRIGIAVVEHQGHFLVGKRGLDSPLAGFAEFPGGKCLSGEEPATCAVRECQEEAGLAVMVDRLLLRREYTYPHATVDLHFFLCHPACETMIKSDCKSFQWIPRTGLSECRFPDANDTVVAMLINSSGPQAGD